MSAAWTKQALNRAFLARQFLLARTVASPLSVVEHLIGLQAQQARPPFIGLWTRISGFERSALLDLIRTRKIVRVTAMRATLHLMSARDYLHFRAALQPALTAALRSILKTRKAELDIEGIVSAAERAFTGKPQTFGELRATLSQQYPGLDERAMGYLARTHVPLIMLPNESEYGYGIDSTFTAAASWLMKPASTEDATEDLIRRYLAAFGPATIADAQSWSGIPKLNPVFERLRPELETFRDENKRELFDLPGAPRPDADVTAPICFLPGFDNAILGHVDRTRIIADEHRPHVATKNLQILPTFLVDGFVAGTWEFTATKKAAKLNLSAFKTLAKPVKQLLRKKARRSLNSWRPRCPAQKSCLPADKKVNGECNIKRLSTLCNHPYGKSGASSDLYSSAPNRYRRAFASSASGGHATAGHAGEDHRGEHGHSHSDRRHLSRHYRQRLRWRKGQRLIGTSVRRSPHESPRTLKDLTRLLMIGVPEHLRPRYGQRLAAAFALSHTSRK
jgi:hypothetical protein